MRVSFAPEKISDALQGVVGLPSVKEVAINAGFTKSGRFAEAFFATFGVRPSDILNRTRTVHGGST